MQDGQGRGLQKGRCGGRAERGSQYIEGEGRVGATGGLASSISLPGVGVGTVTL